MSHPVISFPTGRLVAMGLEVIESIHYQLTAGQLVQDVVRTGEGVIDDNGALAVHATALNGYVPTDQYIVNDAVTPNYVNQSIDASCFDVIYYLTNAYLSALPEFWVRDCYASSGPHCRISIRVVNEHAAGNLFAANTFQQPDENKPEREKPEWHLIAVPGLQLDPATSGTLKGSATVISLTHKTVIIAGTGNTNEMKESVMTVLHLLLPLQ